MTCDLFEVTSYQRTASEQRRAHQNKRDRQTHKEREREREERGMVNDPTNTTEGERRQVRVYAVWRVFLYIFFFLQSVRRYVVSGAPPVRLLVPAVSLFTFHIREERQTGGQTDRRIGRQRQGGGG